MGSVPVYFYELGICRFLRTHYFEIYGSLDFCFHLIIIIRFYYVTMDRFYFITIFIFGLIIVLFNRYGSITRDASSQLLITTLCADSNVFRTWRWWRAQYTRWRTVQCAYEFDVENRKSFVVTDNNDGIW